MSRGRKRPPTADDLQLWMKVVETVIPLGERSAAAATPETKPTQIATPPAAILSAQPRPPKPPPTLSIMDRRTRSRLTRGVVAIGMRIDLHGLTQMTAEGRLRRFLRDAQEAGAKVVLVITGKGSADGERGVLRRVVPHWLASADMRGLVVGFEEASRAHGGAGALYVRIRRFRQIRA